MLRCRDGSLYSGAAKDLGARLWAHLSGRASRYTRSRLPAELVWSRRVRDWSAALRLEHRLKRLAKAEKEALVAGLVRLRAARKAAGTRARQAPASSDARARAARRGAGSRRRRAGRL